MKPKENGQTTLNKIEKRKKGVGVGENGQIEYLNTEESVDRYLGAMLKQIAAKEIEIAAIEEGNNVANTIDPKNDPTNLAAKKDSIKDELAAKKSELVELKKSYNKQKELEMNMRTGTSDMYK